MAVTLTPEDFIQGLMSFFLVMTFTLIGLIILIKYFKYKHKAFLYMGIGWMGVAMPWYPSGFNFVYVLLTGLSFSDEFYFFLGNFFLPIIILFYMAGITELIFTNKQKSIVIIYAIISVIYEIFFLYFFFTDLSVIGYRSGVFSTEHLSFVLAYIIFLTLTVVIFGILFARDSLKADDPEIRLKGKLLLLAFISLLLGGIFDAGIELGPVGLVIIRILLMSSAFEFYLGFILPDWFKKLMLKQE